MDRRWNFVYIWPFSAKLMLRNIYWAFIMPGIAYCKFYFMCYFIDFFKEESI